MKMGTIGKLWTPDKTMKKYLLRKVIRNSKSLARTFMSKKLSQLDRVRVLQGLPM